jgi:hypothetical protein
MEGKIKLIHHCSIAAWWVNTDTHDLEVSRLELFITPGEADQLPIAVWSPIASVKDEHQGLLSQFST